MQRWNKMLGREAKVTRRRCTQSLGRRDLKPLPTE